MKLVKGIFTISFILIIGALLICLNYNSIMKKAYPIEYNNIIFKHSVENNLDPYLVAAVIKTESNFREDVKSNKGACGLMQITPETGQWIAEKMKLKNFSVDKLLTPETNIKMGCWYINNLSKEFNGDMDLVLAAYNGGRGNVRKWLKNSTTSDDGKKLKSIPFKETDNYIKKVNKYHKIYLKLYNTP